MKKPEFEQFRTSTLRRVKAMPQQQREPYRQNIVSLLEDTGLFLVQKARKDGHDDALIEVHGNWVGTDFSVDAVVAALKSVWPGGIFAEGEHMHWIDHEDEVVELFFVWRGDTFLTGHIKITVG